MFSFLHKKSKTTPEQLEREQQKSEQARQKMDDMLRRLDSAVEQLLVENKKELRDE